MSTSGGAIATGWPRPAYATSARNVFDGSKSVYNYKASNTLRHSAGLARAASQLDVCEVFIGDSATDGATSLAPVTFDRPHAWPIMYRTRLASRGVPIAGSGMVRAANNAFAFQDDRLVRAGVWTISNTFLVTTAVNATLTYTIADVGTAVAVTYIGGAGGGTFTVSVDGSVAGVGFATVDSSLLTGTQVVLLTGLANTAHSIVVKCTVAGIGVFQVGAETYTPNGGLTCHNVAQDGGQASGAGANSWSDISNTTFPLSVFGPAATYRTVPTTVHCALGGNDEFVGQTPAQIAAGITIIRNTFPTSDFFLHLEVQAGENSIGTHAAWCTRAYALADTLDVPLFDWQDLLGGWASVVAQGLNGDAVAHLNRAGYAMIGNWMGDIATA